MKTEISEINIFINYNLFLDSKPDAGKVRAGGDGPLDWAGQPCVRHLRDGGRRQLQQQGRGVRHV